MAIKQVKEKKSRDIIGVASMVLAILLVLSLYWRWVLPGIVTLGDWCPTVSGKAMTDSSLSLWNSSGLGGYIIQGIPFLPLVVLSGFLSHAMHYNGAVIELLVIFVPLVLILIISPMYLAYSLGFRKIGIAASIIVFNLNSAIFLIAGVPTLALAIAVGPLVIASFIQSLQKLRFREYLLFSLLLSLQMLYEIRIAYVGVVFCFFYLVYHSLEHLSQKNHYNFPRLTRVLFLMTVVVILIHSYWLIPFLAGMISKTPMVLLPTGYNSAGWVRTLSYWNLLHVLGIQSIFWGKQYIFNPPNAQFLFFPILAFGVFLLPLDKRKKDIFLFFGLAALIFAFLAKGSKPPFGELYIWLFLHFPGFSMFREPGKWWFPVVVSYAVLIGGLADTLINSQNLARLSIWLKKRFSTSFAIIRIYLVVSAIILFFLIFPVNPISSLYYSGIYDPYPVPEEAYYLEDFLHSQPDFFRILWFPTMYRFGYSSSQHPALPAVNLGQEMLSSLCFGDPRNNSHTFSYLHKSFKSGILRLLSVKYIIVPFAPTGQPLIYYWYGFPPEYFQHIADNTTPVIHSVFKGKSKIYEVPNYLPHLYTSSRSNILLSDNELPLSTVAAMGYVEVKNPALIFPEQNSEIIDSLLMSDNFILQDRTFADVSTETAAIHKIPFQIYKKTTKQRLKIEIQKTGTYEFWIDTYKIPAGKNNMASFQIKIDRKILDGEELFSLLRENNERQEYRRYLKVGELGLKSGIHKLQISFEDSNFEHPYATALLVTDNAQRLNDHGYITEKLNQPAKNISYIFTKDGCFYTK